MLPTRTLDQAHHCPKAAWDTPLPPNSRPSTPTKPTATETPLTHTHKHTHTSAYAHIHTYTALTLPTWTNVLRDVGMSKATIPHSPIPQRALCLQQSVFSEWQESTFLQDNTHSNPSIGHTATEQSLMVEGWEGWYKIGTSLFPLLGCDQTSQEKMAQFGGDTC